MVAVARRAELAAREHDLRRALEGNSAQAVLSFGVVLVFAFACLVLWTLTIVDLWGDTLAALVSP